MTAQGDDRNRTGGTFRSSVAQVQSLSSRLKGAERAETRQGMPTHCPQCGRAVAEAEESLHGELIFHWWCGNCRPSAADDPYPNRSAGSGGSAHDSDHGSADETDQYRTERGQ